MLLNEFLKEHCRVQNQERQINEQGKQIHILNERLTAIAAKLQRVSEPAKQSKATPIPAAKVREPGGM